MADYNAIFNRLTAEAYDFINNPARMDRVNDLIPVLGIADDVAVPGLALKFVEPELNAYREWRA